MPLSRKEVEHVAQLAHLALEEEELARYQEQLSAILEHAAALQEIDTEAIPPTATVLPLRSVLRTDEPRPSLPRGQALSNAPRVEGGCFLVPPVREQES